MTEAPRFEKPQLATLADRVPVGDDWMFEYKYDGYRLLIATGEKGAVAYTRNGKDWSHRFHVLVEAAAKTFPPGCLVDGEAVVLGKDGKPDFGAMQRALKDDGLAPLTFFAFDLLVDRGEDVTGLSNVERKARLAALMKKAGPPLHFADHVTGAGEKMLEAICAEGGEGVIAKKASAPYRHRRTRDWLKIKCIARQEFVIVGWAKSDKPARAFKSLLLAVNEGGALRYAGKVGTGFTQELMDDIRAKLDRLSRKTPPLDVPKSDAKDAHWVTPDLVAEIAFTEFTRAGTLRHPSFIGLRTDKPAREIVREAPGLPTAASLGIRISSADRLIFPDAAITKGGLADYYAAIAPAMLETAARRPLTLVRCPQGRAKKCFFQKHDHGGLGEAVKTVPVTEKDGETADYLWTEAAEGLLACVQMGTIEFHGWGSRIDSIEKPDRLVFDLDPDEGLDFAAVCDAAARVRDILKAMKLESFPMLTGGKGVHVIVPLEPKAQWPAVKSFADRFARALAADDPDHFTANIRKAKREGRIFIDWLRNQRGATAVLPYSARAREGAPVAAPVTWDELAKAQGGNIWSVTDLPELLERHTDLAGWGEAKQVLPDL